MPLPPLNGVRVVCKSMPERMSDAPSALPPPRPLAPAPTEPVVVATAKRALQASLEVALQQQHRHGAAAPAARTGPSSRFRGLARGLAGVRR